MLTAAEQALLQDKIDDAARFVETARSLNPEHVRVAFLTAQIGKERERALLTQARMAAARGNVDQAIAVLDRASCAGTSANVVAEARNDIAQRNIDNRVNDFLRRANDRLRAGALVEPAQNNARFFIESARAIAPNQNDVRRGAAAAQRSTHLAGAQRHYGRATRKTQRSGSPLPAIPA